MEKVKVLIEIGKKRYHDIMNDVKSDNWPLSYYERKVASGQFIPNDCEILTREAYSDLCLKAAKFDDDLK